MQKINNICNVEECSELKYGLGYCRKHYRKFKMHGTTDGSNKFHHMCGTKVYETWRGMKQRIFYKKHIEYNNYGGRGITMFDGWVNSFKDFYTYIGEPPTKKHSIDRINVNGNYEPGNIKWSTFEEQAMNKRPVKNSYNLPGVMKTKDTYYSMIVVKGKRIYLGSFRTKEETTAAYIAAKQKYHGWK